MKMSATDELIDKYAEATGTIHSIVLHYETMSKEEFHGWVDSQVPYWKHELEMRYGIKVNHV
jgi:hypothetical protein